MKHLSSLIKKREHLREKIDALNAIIKPMQEAEALQKKSTKIVSRKAMLRDILKRRSRGQSMREIGAAYGYSAAWAGLKHAMAVRKWENGFL